MQNSAEVAANGKRKTQRTTFLVSLCLLAIGTIGYFSLHRDQWLFYVASHLGALGVMGLFGSVAGLIARRKRRSFVTAFLLGSLLPIVLGLASVLALLLGEDGHLYCGGSVCLAIALLVMIAYLIVGKSSRSRV